MARDRYTAVATILRAARSVWPRCGLHILVDRVSITEDTSRMPWAKEICLSATGDLNAACLGLARLLLAYVHGGDEKMLELMLAAEAERLEEEGA